MKAPSVLTALSLLALLAALGMAAKQRSAAQGLRLEAAAIADSLATAAPAPSAPVEPVAPAAEPLSEAERLELLRLRSQITRLRAEARGLEAAKQENASLKERRAAAKANPSSVQSALPTGYILRRTARNVGQATPEAALETFLWAVEHRDLNTLLGTLAPADAQKLAASVTREGEQFWEGVGKLPGMRMSEKQLLPDGSMEVKLSVELEGTGGEQTTKARLVDGRWRLELR
jgi:hypothetical protein